MLTTLLSITILFIILSFIIFYLFLKQERLLKNNQIDLLKTQNDNTTQSLEQVRKQVTEIINQNMQLFSDNIKQLTETTHTQLNQINTQVEKRLEQGFEKTTKTFTDVIERLALIDQAQKKITELSSNVVSLQAVLTDKRSRGAFGEVQLSSLIRNLIPEENLSFQHTLSNNKRADCILFLPEPTGNIVIDSKFPLESFQKLTKPNISLTDKKQFEQQFKVDIKKHIQDISSKYIIPNETADGAMMFIPAEAIFAEIHGHYPELVELAQKSRVWLVSPTTLMAVLTTAKAVLKDAATRKQVHIIQDHLNHLAKDFGRFQSRMDNLSKHFTQVQNDVEQVHTSAKKISSRFEKIEKVELEGKIENPTLNQQEAS